MIEGHGDDSYKYSRPITANFSSNVYNRVDLSALKAHLCARIDGIGTIPNRSLTRLRPALPAATVFLPRQCA